jgi:hypothetical protein
MSLMGTDGRQRGDHDAGERGPDRNMGSVRHVHADQRQTPDQRRYDQQPAPHAEQAGNQSDHRSQQQEQYQDLWLEQAKKAFHWANLVDIKRLYLCVRLFRIRHPRS